MTKAPKNVQDFIEAVIGTRVVYVAPMGSFDGAVQSAAVDGKRIKYAIVEASGQIRTAYADQVAHTWKRIV